MSRESRIDRARRRFGQAAVAVVVLAALAPLRAWAARNNAAFDTKVLEEGVAAIGADAAVETDQILFKSPDIAENGAIVHLEIRSLLPDTRTIWLFAEKNPQPLVAQFDLLPGLEPFVAVRIKMADSAFLRVVVKAADRFYYVRRETKVTIGGCAG